MTVLYELKERMRVFHTKHEMYLTPLCKFAFGLIVFLIINQYVGFMRRIDIVAVPLLLALLCAFLPTGATVVIAISLVIIHFFAISLELAGATFVILLLAYLLYFRLIPKEGMVLILTPIAFGLNIPYVMPIVLGLTKGPYSSVSVGFGTVFFYLLRCANQNMGVLNNMDESAITSKFKFIMDQVLLNKEMYLTIVAFAVTICIVYIIRRLSIDYAWYIAIGVGTVTNMVFLLVGSLIVLKKSTILPLILGSVISLLITLVVQFFVMNVDYTRTERVQFEDDEYYYYVKAIPKISVATTDKKVKEITNKRSQRSGDRKTLANELDIDEDLLD